MAICQHRPRGDAVKTMSTVLSCATPSHWQLRRILPQIYAEGIVLSPNGVRSPVMSIFTASLLMSSRRCPTRQIQQPTSPKSQGSHMHFITIPHQLVSQSHPMPTNKYGPGWHVDPSKHDGNIRSRGRTVTFAKHK